MWGVKVTWRKASVWRLVSKQFVRSLTLLYCSSVISWNKRINSLMTVSHMAFLTVSLEFIRSDKRRAALKRSAENDLLLLLSGQKSWDLFKSFWHCSVSVALSLIFSLILSCCDWIFFQSCEESFFFLLSSFFFYFSDVLIPLLFCLAATRQTRDSCALITRICQNLLTTDPIVSGRAQLSLVAARQNKSGMSTSLK